MSEEIKVSEMQEAKEINDEDIIMIVQEKVNKKATIKQVKGVGGATGDTLPISSIMSYPKAVAPENWLICDGSAVSRTDYSELFNVIGTFFGAGDGKTTFNLPNIKGKTIVGLDNSDTDFNAIGKVLGEKTHTLTVDEMPSHNHSMGSFNQYDDGTGGSFAESEKVGRTTSGADGSKGINPILNTGGSKEHNNIQPSFVGCYIIKAKQSAGVVATVIDNLTSASTIDALSAKQGKILNEKITNANTYSTEEINTGKKWIDGKDIYRKVFVATKTSDNLVIKIADNIDFSYLFSGRLRTYALPFYESEQVYCRAELENNYVTIKGGSSPYSQGTITLIIEYTKTS